MNLILTALIFNLAQNALQATTNSENCLQDKRGNEICKDSMNPDSMYSVKPYDGLTLVPRDVITENRGISQYIFDVTRKRSEKRTKVLLLVSKKVYKNMLRKYVKQAVAKSKKQALGSKKKLFFNVPYWAVRAALVVIKYVVRKETRKIVTGGAKKIVHHGVKIVKDGVKTVIGETAKKIAEEAAKKIIEEAAKIVGHGGKKAHNNTLSSIEIL